MRINYEKFDKGAVQKYINDISCKASALSMLVNGVDLENMVEHQKWGLSYFLEDIFRPIPDSDSDPFRTPIPNDSGHQFRSFRTPITEHMSD